MAALMNEIKTQHEAKHPEVHHEKPHKGEEWQAGCRAGRGRRLARLERLQRVAIGVGLLAWPLF